MWELKEESKQERRRGSPSPKHEDAAEWVKERLGFSADLMQAQVLRTKTKRGMLNCSRQWGKSTILAAKAVHHAQRTAGSLTLVASPGARQSGEFLKKAKEFARRLGIRSKGDGYNEISLELPNRSRIVGLPGTEDRIRGFSAVTLLLVDEAARVSDEMYRTIRPMLAVSDGTLWLMSTPNGRQGFFYETWEHGGPEWERFQAPATECSRIRPEFLEEERATMGERSFRQEYLCEFEDSESGLFDGELVDRAITKDVTPLVIP